MMKIHKIQITFLILLTIWSCREVYYPEDIESDRQIPVIQGSITKDGVAEVTLYWAIKYNSENQEFISGAEVYIEDNLGGFVRLNEYSPGVYTDFYSEMVGMVGNTYKLRVVLQNGNVYESTPQMMFNEPVIDSLYADPGIREVYTYSTSNKPILQKQEGLNILSGISGNGNDVLYYRFHTTALKMMVYITEIGTLNSHSVYLWETSKIDKSFSVDYSSNQQEKQVLTNHPIGFLWYYYDVNLETPSQTAPYTEGWVLTSNVYSISRDVFEYYNSIDRQLSSNNQIFAPVTSQVKSNITCITDPSEAVIGVFEANSITTVYKAFRWRTLDSYISLDLPFFPQGIPDGSVHRFAPYFWVYF